MDVGTQYHGVEDAGVQCSLMVMANSPSHTTTASQGTDRNTLPTRGTREHVASEQQRPPSASSPRPNVWRHILHPSPQERQEPPQQRQQQGGEEAAWSSVRTRRHQHRDERVFSQGDGDAGTQLAATTTSPLRMSLLRESIQRQRQEQDHRQHHVTDAMESSLHPDQGPWWHAHVPLHRDPAVEEPLAARLASSRAALLAMHASTNHAPVSGSHRVASQSRPLSSAARSSSASSSSASSSASASSPPPSRPSPSSGSKMPLSRAPRAHSLHASPTTLPKQQWHQQEHGQGGHQSVHVHGRAQGHQHFLDEHNGTARAAPRHHDSNSDSHSDSAWPAHRQQRHHHLSHHRVHHRSHQHDGNSSTGANTFSSTLPATRPGRPITNIADLAAFATSLSKHHKM